MTTCLSMRRFAPSRDAEPSVQVVCLVGRDGSALSRGADDPLDLTVAPIAP